MRYLVVLLILSGCAFTPEQRAEALIRDYGPMCDKLGFQRDTDHWRNCVLSSYQATLQAAGVGAANAANVQRAMQPRP